MLRHKKFDFRTAYIDLLLNVLTGVIFLFILTTLMIQPVKKNNQEGPKRDAQFIVTATWGNTVDCDVDLWVQDPLGNIAWFQQKDIGLMHLERDDLGSKNSILFDKLTGKVYTVPNHGETWVLRGIVPGMYTVNLHLYSCHTAIGGALMMLLKTPVEVPVSVDLTKVNPNVELIQHKDVVLQHVWEEQTVFNFTINEFGNVESITDIPKQMVSTKRGGMPQ